MRKIKEILHKTALRSTTGLYLVSDVIGFASMISGVQENLLRVIGSASGLLGQSIGIAFGQEGRTGLKQRFLDLMPKTYLKIPYQWRPESNPTRITYLLNMIYGFLYVGYSVQNNMIDTAISNAIFSASSATKAFEPELVEITSRYKSLSIRDRFNDEGTTAALKLAFQKSTCALARNPSNVMTCTAAYAVASGYAHRDWYLFAQGVFWTLAAINVRFIRNREYIIEDVAAPKLNKTPEVK
ncbi:MAG: hypothetical protein KDJ50_07170 [Alphaproteobacteria bacterium]|nr:hypothetical protein [Alphaproteobacteria bacterium]